jgi:hypothetical protein
VNGVPELAALALLANAGLRLQPPQAYVSFLLRASTRPEIKPHRTGPLRGFFSYLADITVANISASTALAFPLVLSLRVSRQRCGPRDRVSNAIM